MQTLTPDAQQHLDQYLQVVRLFLRGTGLPAEEVEADVREHIATALESEEAPVPRPVLERVLERLGPPAVWVPDDELPAWRRWARRLVRGPEDWRLAYLCFGLFVLSLATAPFGGVVFDIAAYFVARAAHAVAREQGVALGARRWLIYPPLVFISLAIGLVIFAGPVPPLAVWGIEEGGFLRLAGGDAGRLREGRLAVHASFVAIVAGTWWLLVAVFAARYLHGFRSLLLPLAERLERRHLVRFAACAALLAVAGAAVLVLVR
jgi:hypothetical protein